MEHGKKSMAQLREALTFYGGGVDALDSIDDSRTIREQGSVVVDPHSNPFFHETFTQFFHQGIVATIHVGVAFCAHDGYF